MLRYIHVYIQIQWYDYIFYINVQITHKYLSYFPHVIFKFILTFLLILIYLQPNIYKYQNRDKMYGLGQI